MIAEEAAFVAALAADPSDAVTRSVFADWLGEQGRDEDEARQRKLVEGYTAIRVWRLDPSYIRELTWFNANHGYVWPPLESSEDRSNLPGDWFGHLKAGMPLKSSPWTADDSWRDYKEKAEAFADAAQAFAKLPKRRRAELLRGPRRET